MVPQLSAGGAPVAEDVCLPFIIGHGAFRGRLVRLTGSVSEILACHNDPPEVSVLLAEAVAAAVALASGLKYDGVFTLQIQGTGPVHMLVVDVTSNGELRACAKFDADRLAVALAKPRLPGAAPLLTGPSGHLAFTVDQGPETERYQGIVALSGESLAESVHHYFRQSEQIESALKIAIGAPKSGGQWTAGAVLIQRMPEDGGRPVDREEAEDAWRTAVILLGSLKDSELLDLTLPPDQLVRRLYLTIGLRLLDRRPVRAKCRCSRERSERILASFPIEEVRSYAQDGIVHMTCEFCRTDYAFSESELTELAVRNRPQAFEVKK
ncbi:MAG: Hsp33 family molecular chaperone HslO [Rhodospirillaceae bacterium]